MVSRRIDVERVTALQVGELGADYRAVFAFSLSFRGRFLQRPKSRQQPQRLFPQSLHQNAH
jgi:hypothetical protein